MRKVMSTTFLSFLHVFHININVVHGMAVPNYSRNTKGRFPAMIYLYLKTHNITGLKYLGKTINSDPHLYQGSGLIWKRHLAKHGYDVTTEILFQCEDTTEFSKNALSISKKLDVVNSKKFANLMHESGDGGAQEWTIQSRKKLSNTQKKRGICPNPGYNTSQQKTNISNSMKMYLQDKDARNKRISQLHSKENRKKAAKTISSLKWCNDGNRNYRLKTIPDGFYPGRLPLTT